MKKCLLILVILLVILSSCMQYSDITQGAITNKAIIPEHYIDYEQYIKINGENMLVVTPLYIPECYQITIANQGKIRKLYIPKSDYDSLSIGDWYTI